MPVLDAKILTAGKAAISDALLGVNPALPHSFIIGDSFGFEPTDDMLTVAGTKVFTGDATAISATRISEDTVRYVCSLSETHGPFQIGNLILNMSSLASGVTPFIAVVLPVPIQKQQSDPTFTDQGFQVPGSRVAINIEIKHTEEIEIANVTVITPNYSSLPTFETELDVPEGAALTFKQAVISYHSAVRMPVLMTVDANNVRWGMPFTQGINHPYFGHLDGGTDGEGYGGDPSEIIFGYYYLTPEATFTYPSIGGADYTGLTSGVVGGASYDDTVLSATNFVP